MMDDLTEQTVIVTGGARGIGRAIAAELGDAGAEIVVADIDEEAAHETASELREDGLPVESVACDVASTEDVERLVVQTLDRFGGIDALVNNAGIGSRGSFEELTHEDWQRVIDVNLTGAFNCSRAVVPGMIDGDGGSIVNISSMAGRSISYHGSANYTASKWGLIGLTKHMAWDLGEHGIRVTAVCPGSTLTPLTESGTTPEERASTTEKIPLDRWASPEDHAAAVAYLISKTSSYVTGTVLEVDGGKQLGVRNEI
ncbi:3-oxoacyl-[acyl-carrier protein] reductase [Natronorubrum sediminis]|uniref:3-oxoacyl-[acyl-carrier protein] reductase n=1 Tax=Natronorubrum sediminis TaxID=640943 RepID=A0A1H6G439_9EURY|nr:SDR family NAD(P)-dependent oxidoreductase [Natronorubrum sediminis]SEH17819.1 3-oxoacyl-[acyl-carrier protein] reductase [Natronorubrum sediminis]